MATIRKAKRTAKDNEIVEDCGHGGMYLLLEKGSTVAFLYGPRGAIHGSITGSQLRRLAKNTKDLDLEE